MSVARLLDPRSIAIVGASDKVGPGFNAWNALRALGFEGDVHLVNPGRQSLFGQQCHPSIESIPAEIDAVFIAVPADRVLDTVRQAAAKRCGGLAILSSGFGEAGPQGARSQRGLADLAQAHGLAVCGPNCLGLLNFAGKSALFGTSLPAQLPAGSVGAVVQSGSVGIALLNSARGLGLSHLITSGNEAVTTAADYVEALVADPRVSTIVVFLEQLRQPHKFIAACQRAKAGGKPVIVLKSGRTEAGQSAVLAHTGAVAGSVEVCDAAFREAGVIQVFSLDELIEQALLSSSLTARVRGRGAAMMSLSGGEIALALDAASDVELNLPPLGAARAALEATLPPGLNVSNPLDLSWAGLYDSAIARRCAAAFSSEPDVGLLLLLQDAPTGLGEQQAARYSKLLDSVAEGAADAALPLVAISNISGDTHPEYARVARERSVVTLRGTHEGVAAVARHFAWQANDRQPLRPKPTRPVERSAAEALLNGAGDTRVLDEVTSRSILACYGLPVIRERLVDTPSDAAAAAEEIGSVAIKAVVPDVAHKTELGLVRLNINTPGRANETAHQLLEQADRMGRRAGARLLIQEMIRPVAELLIGARIDPQFGPVIVVGGGGTTVELFKDVAIRLAPVTPEAAIEMIRSTKSCRLIDGWRGKPKGDLSGAAQVVSLVSRFIADFEDAVSEVEINPLAVLEAGHGCRPVDCLIVRR